MIHALFERLLYSAFVLTEPGGFCLIKMHSSTNGKFSNRKFCQVIIDSEKEKRKMKRFKDKLKMKPNIWKCNMDVEIILSN